MRKRIIKGILLIVLFSITFVSCISDRVAPEPVEINRPVFKAFSFGQANFNIPLNSQIRMQFNEKMDLSTFPGNCRVVGAGGEINGTFSYAPEADTVVVFTPSTNFQPAEYYEITLGGAVKDVHGMSVISPLDQEVKQKSWFFTSGEYSKDGFPYVFVRDRIDKRKISRIGNLNQLKDSLMLAADDFQTSPLKIGPDGKLFVVNYKASNGTVTVVDPASFAVSRISNAGNGASNVAFSDNKAYVPNSATSSKSFSVIDLQSGNTEATYVFPDGFRPKDVVYSKLTNKLYFTNNSTSELKVVNAADFNDSHSLKSVISNKAVDIEITNDGKYIYIIEDRSAKVTVLDASTETVARVLDLGYSFNVDGAMGKDAYYVAYFRNVDKQNIGGILKVGLSSGTLLNKIEWDYEVDKIELTSAGELLYAVVPGNATLQIIEAKTMHKIAETQLSGSPKYITITKNNYK